MDDVIDRIEDRQEIRSGSKSLAALFERANVSFDDCRHMAIDVQGKFLETLQSEEVVQHLIADIAPAFQSVGIPTYWVYWPEIDHDVLHDISVLEKDDFKAGAAAIYDIWPAAIDKVIPKSVASALKHGWSGQSENPTLTEQVLKKDEAKLLLVSGFAFEVCVYETVKDAINKGYHVVILSDGTDGPTEKGFQIVSQYNGNALGTSEYIEYAEQANKIRFLSELEDLGAVFASSKDVVHEMKQRALQRPTISI